MGVGRLFLEVAVAVVAVLVIAKLLFPDGGRRAEKKEDADAGE